MDGTALFQISYGIYLITAHNEGKDSGCLVNTVFQITAEPVRVAVSVSKHNFTHEQIVASGTVAIGVVGEQTDTGLLGRFGYRSSRDFDKFADLPSHRDTNGDACIDAPGILAHISGKVVQTIDLDTHTVFICEVTDAQRREEGIPMTYNYFRDVKKLKASKYAPTYYA